MESRRGRSEGKVVDVKLPWKYRTGKAREFFHEVQALTWTHAGPIRNAESLREGLSMISEMEGR
jgi:hypothetical protein